MERSYAKNGTESSKSALLTLLLERISWLHRFSDALGASLDCAEECLPAHETLEHEPNIAGATQISTRFLRAALRSPPNFETK